MFQDTKMYTHTIQIDKLHKFEVIPVVNSLEQN